MTDYDFARIVSEVALKENIQHCKLEQQYSTNKGDGYLGIVKAVQLVGSNKTLDVVMKYSLRNKQAHANVPLREAYLNEMHFYEVIAPTFAKFQEDHNITDPFNNTAKFYASVKEPFNELLVFENLKAQNYDLWNRKQLMNKQHLEFAVKTFGKFHGISFAMQKVNPKAYNDLINSMNKYDLFQTFIERMNFMKQLKQMIKKILCIFDPVTEKKYWEKMDKFADNVEAEMNDAISYHEDDIILQGDCWCNNMMFQYEDMDDRTTPKDMKLLDFQLVKFGSPVLDLSYFFYTIAPKESFDNVEYFLKLYHNSLTEHMKKFNVNAEQIFPYSKLLKHWEKSCKFGLMMCVCLRRAMLVESDDAPDISENVEEFVNNWNIDAEKEKMYHQQMKELVMHFIDRNFI